MHYAWANLAEGLHKSTPNVVNELLGAKRLLLRASTGVDATLVAAPSATKNASVERNLPMKQKRWFGQVNVRQRGLARNTVKLHTLFALSDLRMAHRPFDGSAGVSATANGQMAGKQARRHRKADARRAEYLNLLGDSAMAHFKAHFADFLKRYSSHLQSSSTYAKCLFYENWSSPNDI